MKQPTERANIRFFGILRGEHPQTIMTDLVALAGQRSSGAPDRPVGDSSADARACDAPAFHRCQQTVPAYRWQILYLALVLIGLLGFVALLARWRL